MPIALRGDLLPGMANLREACEKGGRDFDELEKAVFAARPDVESCQELIQAGFTDLAFALPSVGEDEALPLLDRYAELAIKLR